MAGADPSANVRWTIPFRTGASDQAPSADERASGRRKHPWLCLTGCDQPGVDSKAETGKPSPNGSA